MSYRLINSNEIAIKYPEVNDMPCIYADLPDGLNGEFYDLSVYPKIIDKLEQSEKYDIEDIKKEIQAHVNACYEMYNGDITGSDEYKYRAQGLQKALDIIKIVTDKKQEN